MTMYELSAAIELKRIADALTAIATKLGVNIDHVETVDESDVLYTDDEELERRELLRMEYFERTGIRLPDDELPPSPRRD
jgi:hypothetical protein